MQFLPLAIVMLVMWVFLVVPQQRKAKAHRELLANLEVGDYVLTAAGLYGVITEFDGPTVFLDVSEGMEIKVTRSSVNEVIKDS